MPEYDSTIQYRDVEGYPGYKVGSDGSDIFAPCWFILRNSFSFTGSFSRNLSANVQTEWRHVTSTVIGRITVCRIFAGALN